MAITTFNLILDFAVMLGLAVRSDVNVSFALNALILIYMMHPGVSRAFGTD